MQVSGKVTSEIGLHKIVNMQLCVLGFYIYELQLSRHLDTIINDFHLTSINIRTSH